MWQVCQLGVCSARRACVHDIWRGLPLRMEFRHQTGPEYSVVQVNLYVREIGHLRPGEMHRPLSRAW
eukprot:3982543-Pleurochrysis_carterae.AAC.1